MRHLLLALALPLAACATPREKCEDAATRDLKIVTDLITETEQNIARGYAISRTVEERYVLNFCFSDDFKDGKTRYVMCNEWEPRVVEKPVAIDLDAERKKLVSLKKQQDSLKAVTIDRLKTCAREYSET